METSRDGLATNVQKYVGDLNSSYFAQFDIEYVHASKTSELKKSSFVFLA